jgi:hypothetical protein
MSISGNISTMPLSDIFQWLSVGQKTGTLVIKYGKTTKEVYFRGGRVLSASSSDPREFMGQFLLNTNKLTERQLKVALDMQNRDEKMLGKILLDQKVLSEDELKQILKTISEEVIYDLFLWETGQFDFVDNQLPRREITAFDLDITTLVLEGMRRKDEWQRIKAVFPSENTILKLDEAAIVRKLPLHSNEAGLLRLVDGNRSLKGIALEVRASLFKVSRAFFDLYEAGLVKVGTYQKNLIGASLPVHANPDQGLVQKIRSALDTNHLEQAFQWLAELKELDPKHHSIADLEHALREKELETTAKQMIRITAVPDLSMSIEEITKLPLTPEEGFIISRINGMWDVKSIMRIAPFDENLSLKIFKKFLDDGVILFK